jgi:glycosyltransferase involved in cell wall biosynthesis
MKIVLASSSSGSRGGGELYLLYLGRALAQRGHRIILWASSHPRMDELTNSFSAFGEVKRSAYHNTYDLRGRSITGQLNLYAAGKAAFEWRQLEPDIVHLNKQNLEDGLDLLRATRLSRLPNLCTIHLTQSAHFLRAKFAILRDAVSKRALRRYPGLLVTVLESRRRDLLEFIGPSPRVRLIPNGVPMFDLSQKEVVRAGKRQELGYAPADMLFVAVGRMVSQKRPLLFLDLAERIRLEIPGAQFLWVGDGDLSTEWDTIVKQRDLSRFVRRLSWQPDVQTLLFAADVFLHVAEYEGLPLAVLEAMSAALPVMLTPNLLHEMSFLNANNSIPLAEGNAWVDALNDRLNRHRRGLAARQLCEAEFSFSKMAENYEMLYNFTLRRQST